MISTRREKFFVCGGEKEEGTLLTFELFMTRRPAHHTIGIGITRRIETCRPIDDINGHHDVAADWPCYDRRTDGPTDVNVFYLYRQERR